jgi:anhydro-N-acetylmuramic acid kinase
MGLMTGTSMDGLDLAVVDIVIKNGYPVPSNVISHTIPFPGKLKKQISLAVSGNKSLYKSLDDTLGRWIADVAFEYVNNNNISNIELIGIHGQTVFHESGVKSIQVGNPKYLVNTFNIPVIYDFRSADINVGGTGAPLIPKIDEWIFQRKKSAVMCVNIGGIANVTLMPPKEKGKILGFDTGPGMAMLDEIYRSHFIEGYDISGKVAKKGRINKALVNDWMNDSFIQKIPPKSTGRDNYGHSWITEHRNELDSISFEDRLANLAYFTARSIIHGCYSFLDKWNVSECVISGGGSHHEQIFFHLGRLLYPVSLKRADEYGFSVDGKEAIGFALLAVAHVKNIFGNIPSVTGATKEVVLGNMVKP